MTYSLYESILAVALLIGIPAYMIKVSRDFKLDEEADQADFDRWYGK